LITDRTWVGLVEKQQVQYRCQVQLRAIAAAIGLDAVRHGKQGLERGDTAATGGRHEQRPQQGQRMHGTFQTAAQLEKAPTLTAAHAVAAQPGEGG
jgi:hypothetical protein